MKKLVSLLVVFILLFSVFAGCAAPAGGNKEGTNKAAASASTVSEEPSESAAATDNNVKAGGAGNASDSYNAYIKAKGKAFELISKKMEGNDSLAMLSLTLLPVATVDLTLIPLTVVSNPEGASALSILGMADIKISGANNEYTIMYTTKDSSTSKESTITQTCKYDPATDSMQSKVTDETGKESMYFEYVKTSGGYASQYYYSNDDGTFGLITSYFNDTDLAAFGIQTVKAEPATIIGNTSLTVDFVKGGDSYFIIQDGKLTVFNEGKTETY